MLQYRHVAAILPATFSTCRSAANLCVARRSNNRSDIESSPDGRDNCQPRPAVSHDVQILCALCTELCEVVVGCSWPRPNAWCLARVGSHGGQPPRLPTPLRLGMTRARARTATHRPRVTSVDRQSVAKLIASMTASQHMHEIFRQIDWTKMRRQRYLKYASIGSAH